MLRQLLLAACLLLPAAAASANPPEKDWTILVFLNGNNNLNRYARDNLLDIEHVGSSDRVNIAVQWADYEYRDTRRLYVTKNPNADLDHLLTSQRVDDLGRNVDMGDWRTLVDFIRWGVEHYPAKHYFIDVWDHGTGWHDKDISEDDFSKHWITTLQLGQVFEEAARIIGHKVDIFGNDACEMGMIEIAAEVAGSVNILAGSEADIPLDGWPYKPFLEKWEARPEMPAVDVAKLLETEYIDYYIKAHHKDKQATFSILDLDRMPEMLGALTDLGRTLSGLGGANLKKAREALLNTTGFTLDYIDLIEFTDGLSRAGLEGDDGRVLSRVREATSRFVVANGATPYYEPHAHGVAIWISPVRKFYEKYVGLYRKLKFAAATRWDEAIRPLAN